MIPVSARAVPAGTPNSTKVHSTGMQLDAAQTQAIVDARIAEIQAMEAAARAEAKSGGGAKEAGV